MKEQHAFNYESVSEQRKQDFLACSHAQNVQL